jgi:hypothetical protein
MFSFNLFFWKPSVINSLEVLFNTELDFTNLAFKDFQFFLNVSISLLALQSPSCFIFFDTLYFRYVCMCNSNSCMFLQTLFPFSVGNCSVGADECH